MSDFKQYTDEQLEKIERLRAEANKPKPQPMTFSDSEWSPYRKLKATDRVTVNIDGNTVIGYILAISGDNHTISTPYGIMKNIPKSKLRLRYFKDLSHVVIPEELKTFTTPDLLSELNNRRNGYDYDDDGYYQPRTSKFSDDQIRAELRTRPNIGNSRSRKIVKKYSK